MVKKKIQNVKGFRDFLPDDMEVLNYITDVWRNVCRSYGFEEYNGPVLEYTKIYNKSGDDVGTSGKELYSFTDQGGRELALRPEMTPSIARMISQYGSQFPTPIKWFSIAQFFRAEKPQRGRGREFFQLNADIFGEKNILSDYEIIALSVDIMLAFGAKQEMFTIRINNRKFSDYYFETILKLKDDAKKSLLRKTIDSAPKKDTAWLKEKLKEISSDKDFFNKVQAYLKLSFEDLEKFVKKSDGAANIISLFKLLNKNNKDIYCTFDPAMARGFDYYTGMVFEVFDNNPKNNRAMFGGGRYDNLMDIFDSPQMPAIGFAPGDMTTKLFLESWNLLPKTKQNAKCLVTIFSEETIDSSFKIVELLRSAKISTLLYLSQTDRMSKQLKYADRKSIRYAIIIGPDEILKNEVILKDLKTKTQESIPSSSLLVRIQ